MTRPNTWTSRRSIPSGPFTCIHCGMPVVPHALGTVHRNHCPCCLWSRHLDLRPGDRLCACRGPMEPIALWFRGGMECALIHRCTRCGTLRSNRIAGDDDAEALDVLAHRVVELTRDTVHGRIGP